MPKVKISEYSSTANSNTDVASINIDEGCAPSGINNAIRAVMGHLKDFQAGLSGDTLPVASGGTGSATGAAALIALGERTSATGSVKITTGTTAQRDASPTAGMFRFNTSTAEFEGYNGTAFASVGGAALSNDTATATSVFPLFANATTGTASSVFTSNAQYLFKPSLGELSVKAVRASNGIFTNSATVSANATIATGDNGGSFGPTTINSGITLTVSSGSVYTVV